ncbi:hypothetical protein C0J52_17223 [Blattella germanica]|nr:hypothetical protein C0J52_17223 [Blattella germanica]
MNPWICLAFNRELVRILVQHIFCRTRDTASYKTGSGGSGSSTATVADPGLANGRKKAFTRFAHSTLVTKMSETEIAFPKNSKPETARQVSLLTTSLFSKNSVTTTCCTSGSDGDTVSPWGSTRAGQGFTRTGAIRKKNQCDTQRSPMEREDKKCFTYSFVSKSDDSVPKEVVEDLEPVVALLHGEPSGDECRRLQVHF